MKNRLLKNKGQRITFSAAVIMLVALFVPGEMSMLVWLAGVGLLGFGLGMRTIYGERR